MMRHRGQMGPYDLSTCGNQFCLEYPLCAFQCYCFLKVANFQVKLAEIAFVWGCSESKAKLE